MDRRDGTLLQSANDSTCSRHGWRKESLRISLDRHRDVVLWKLQGLDGDQVRRQMTPSGTSLLGLVKHLAATEYCWFSETFGRETEPLPFDDDDPEADLRPTPAETTADIVAFYGRARAASDKVIDELEIDGVGTAWHGESAASSAPGRAYVASGV